MDLTWSVEHEQLRVGVRDFLKANSDWAPAQMSGARLSGERLKWQKLLLQKGYAARTVPCQYGTEAQKECWMGTRSVPVPPMPLI